MDFINFKNWGLISSAKKGPILISGPCSAESRAQVMETCALLPHEKVHILRAGIWKPRTRPNSFEGLGEIALPWLVEAGNTLQLPTCVEVANPLHVEKALKGGIDVLWIGARTTVNPFAVQDIADSLKGVDVPILIKNPINPDIDLWIGAIERVYGAGIRKIMCIHRGFSTYGKHPYRNKPQWEIPIELRRRLPGMEILCDPSHIGGQRRYIHELAQLGMDLNMDGWMIESHIDPENAWSDKAQQLKPKNLSVLLDQLIIRKNNTDDPEFAAKIISLRTMIDDIDANTLEICEKRFISIFFIL